VEITNSPIREFTETGIVTEDGKHRDFDVIAICTGYDAVTGGLRTMGIKGRDGMDLDEKWKDGVITQLGMFVNGFPNFLMVYGPQGKHNTSFPVSLWILMNCSTNESKQWTTVFGNPGRLHLGAVEASER